MKKLLTGTVLAASFVSCVAMAQAKIIVNTTKLHMPGVNITLSAKGGGGQTTMTAVTDLKGFFRDEQTTGDVLSFKICPYNGTTPGCPSTSTPQGKCSFPSMQKITSVTINSDKAGHPSTVMCTSTTN